MPGAPISPCGGSCTPWPSSPTCAYPSHQRPCAPSTAHVACGTHWVSWMESSSVESGPSSVRLLWLPAVSGRHSHSMHRRMRGAVQAGRRSERGGEGLWRGTMLWSGCDGGLNGLGAAWSGVQRRRGRKLLLGEMWTWTCAGVLSLSCYHSSP